MEHESEKTEAILQHFIVGRGSRGCSLALTGYDWHLRLDLQRTNYWQ